MIGYLCMVTGRLLFQSVCVTVIVVSTLVQGGIDWAQEVGPQNALTGLTVVATAARLKATGAVRAAIPLVRAAAQSSPGCITMY